jgi:hypothetical protein
MQDDVSRLVGIDGLVVTGVADHGWWLELEVELVGQAGCCRRCGRGSLMVKERDLVRIRDLPIAGRLSAVEQAAVSLRGVRADAHRDTSRAAVASASQRPVSRQVVRALRCR